MWASGGAVLATAATVAAVLVLSQGQGPGTGPAAGRDVDPGFAGTSSAPSDASPTRPPRRRAPGRPRRTSSAAPAAANGCTPRRTTTWPGLPLFTAVDRSLAGRAADPDYGTLWPRGTVMLRTALENGRLYVDLHGAPADRPASLTESQAALAVQQLVWSAQSTAGRPVPVTFVVDGHPTRTLPGVPTELPVSIGTPVEAAAVSSPFTVTGRAAAFEANVQWELVQGGTVVKHGFSTAAECCTLSPYSFAVTAPPGDYTLVVHDGDPSGAPGQGAPPWRDTKDITVRRGIAADLDGLTRA